MGQDSPRGGVKVEMVCLGTGSGPACMELATWHMREETRIFKIDRNQTLKECLRHGDLGARRR